MVMGKAYAPLRNTAPADQAAVDSCLRDLQGYADRLVFGRWWLRCVAPRVETTNDTCLAARRA